MGKKIAIFGGSFDPVHLGHLNMARAAVAEAGLDELVFVPTRIQPFKQDRKVTIGPHRLSMIETAIADDRHIFSASEFELLQESVSYSYLTLRHFRRLYEEKYGPDTRLYFLTGADSFLKVEKWMEAEEILTSYGFIVGARPASDTEGIKSKRTGVSDSFKSGCDSMKSDYSLDQLDQCIENIRKAYGTEIIKLSNQEFPASSSEIREAIAEFGKEELEKEKAGIRCSVHEGLENILKDKVPDGVIKYIRKCSLYGLDHKDYGPMLSLDFRSLIDPAYHEQYDRIKAFQHSNLDDHRIAHTNGVAQLAMDIALKIGADVSKACMGAQLHDVAKCLTRRQCDEEVMKYGLDKSYLSSKNVAHGPIAGAWGRDKFGIEDEDILNAARYHTTARAEMSPVEKCVFIGDAAEIGRDYPDAEYIRIHAADNVDAACLYTIIWCEDNVIAKGHKVHHLSTEAKEYFEAFVPAKDIAPYMANYKKQVADGVEYAVGGKARWKDEL